MGKTRGVVPTAGAEGLSEGEAAAYRPGGAIRPGGGVLASTRLKRAGGSLVIVVPAAARNLLGLAEGQELAVSVDEGKIVLEPLSGAAPQRFRRPKYTLDQLVEGMDPDAPRRTEDQGWMNEPPAGREVW